MGYLDGWDGYGEQGAEAKAFRIRGGAISPGAARLPSEA